MNLDIGSPRFEDDLQLNSLLDYSEIAESRQLSQSYEPSIYKDKLNLSQKERTREQSYEDICRQINQAKLEQLNLNKHAEELKQNTYSHYLGPLRQEFQQLNKQNLILRGQVNQLTKIKDNKKQRLSNTSSVNPRTKKNSVVGDLKSKNHIRNSRKQASPHMLLKKKQIKITQISSNLERSQRVSPRVHRRRQTKLTERKMQQNESTPVSMDASYFDQKNSHSNKWQSMSKNQLKQDCGNKNIFIQILQRMLFEERTRDKEKYHELYLQASQTKQMQKIKRQVKYVNQLQEEIQISNEKLQMLVHVMQKYQTQMQGMDINLKNVQEVYKKLYSVKGKFVEMQKKCSELAILKKEAYQKQKFLDKKKESIANEKNESNSNNISSVQAMIKIISNNPNRQFKSKHSSLYFTYCREIKNIFRQNNEQQSKQKNKMLKVREMIQNIRQGRKKFNDLIQVYQVRIEKLEQKIAKVRGLQTDKRSCQ